MFEPTHMAVGALIQAKVKKKVPTALIAVASHAALDMTIFWHARDAQYQWPKGSFPLFEVVPYPHDIQSDLLVAGLIAATIAVAVLLRRYWWGMLWAISPDIIDWGIVRPLTGQGYIHKLFDKVSTPWGFLVEMLLTASITLGVYLWTKRQRPLRNNPPRESRTPAPPRV